MSDFGVKFLDQTRIITLLKEPNLMETKLKNHQLILRQEEVESIRMFTGLAIHH